MYLRFLRQGLVGQAVLELDSQLKRQAASDPLFVTSPMDHYIWLIFSLLSPVFFWFFFLILDLNWPRQPRTSCRTKDVFELLKGLCHLCLCPKCLVSPATRLVLLHLNVFTNYFKKQFYQYIVSTILINRHEEGRKVVNWNL